jgi:putative ABC transport system permease protein
VVALGLSATALCLMGFIRTDLLDQWAKASPTCAPEVATSAQVAQGAVEEQCKLPNRFIINVQDHQREALALQLQQQGIQNVEFWPMLRGRYMQLNGQARPAEIGQRARRLAEREFNLSIASTLPADNAIAAGRFFKADATSPEMSVEIELAQSLGWKLGDRVQFDLGGITTEATITSLRTVNWDNFKPNFFVLLNEAAWQDLPRSWISSLYLKSEQISAFESVLAAHSNVTVLDLDFIQAQVRALIAQVTRAIEAVFWFTLISGILVLIGTIDATQHERKLDASVMRVLGAQSAQLRRFDTFEFALIGLTAATIGAFAANALCQVIARQLFGFDFSSNWALIAACIAFGTMLVIVIGLSQTRSTRTRSSLASIRALT